MSGLTLSLDLDDVWTYLKVRGDTRWRERPTHFAVVVPAMLELLDSAQAQATVFVVGADATMDDRAPWLERIVAAGHEIGNHSHEHLSWQRALTEREVEDDLRASHDALTRLTGTPPVGYRSPGFSWNRTVLKTLAQLGYQYDASVFPTWLGPLSRAAYRMRAHSSPEHLVRLNGLFGEARDSILPVRPYRWTLPDGHVLTEVPVTTVPFLRIPLHHTYVAYLASFSETLALAYVTGAIRLCRLSGTPISYLLHPTDLVGADAVPALRFFPGMDMSTVRKQRLLARVLQLLTARGPSVSLRSFVASLDPARLPVRSITGSRAR